MLGGLEGTLTSVANWIIGIVEDFFLFVVLLYFISSLNSSATTSGLTQPRSQQRERSASSVRPRDNSHIGVSGTCEMDSLLSLKHLRAHYFLLALPLPRSNSIRYKYPTQSIHWHTSFTCLWRCNRQWVPKRRLLELRRRRITQKGTRYK